MHRERAERRHLRVVGDVVVSAIAVVLSEYDGVGQDAHRLDDGCSRLVVRLVAVVGRSFHQRKGRQLDQVVLHDVVDHSHLLVEGATVGYIPAFTKLDRDARDAVSVEDPIKRVRCSL